MLEIKDRPCQRGLGILSDEALSVEASVRCLEVPTEIWLCQPRPTEVGSVIPEYMLFHVGAEFM
jgi:hypothetical protein